MEAKDTVISLGETTNKSLQIVMEKILLEQAEISFKIGKRESESMRILGFSRKWNKLGEMTFTTYRFPRKDTDWAVEEVVQCVYKPRSKEREILGVARIIRKQVKDLHKRFHYYTGGYLEPNTPDMITPDEAEADGFTGMHGGGDTEKMRKFFFDTYGYFKCKEPINKLTLYWVSKP